jgi:plastocyanin
MRRVPILVLAVLMISACAPVMAQPATATGQKTAPAVNSAPVANAGPATYTVLVGAEDTAQGVDAEAYFPATLHIHVGDTVDWKANSKEIHTVTFLDGTTPVPQLMIPVPNGPQGAMMPNPEVAFPTAPDNGLYDGTGFLNSGVVSTGEGFASDFPVTFTEPGTYEYQCIVHEEELMKGTIVVEDASATIQSPQEAEAAGRQEMADLMAKAPELIGAALAEVTPDTTNADGSVTHHVLVGYSSGQIDLMSFFPKDIEVRPGDTVVWDFASQNVAPHTITFLNGEADMQTFLLTPATDGGQPSLIINPDVAMPKNADQPLTDQGIYSSGLIDPAAPGPHSFSLTIGDVTGELPYVCLLHDESGMRGTLTVPAAN